jgi:CheY-like chemotaxis protein
VKVLVVDDNGSNREYARQVLTSHWEVEQAEGGPEALDALAKSIPDLLLLDLSMPVVDGWEVLRSIRAKPQTRELPVIACSAHAMRGDRERALAAGFDAYLTKPYRPTELVTMVEEFLGAPAARAKDDDDGWGGDDWSLSDEDWGDES